MYSLGHYFFFSSTYKPPGLSNPEGLDEYAHVRIRGSEKSGADWLAKMAIDTRSVWSLDARSVWSLHRVVCPGVAQLS